MCAEKTVRPLVTHPNWNWQWRLMKLQRLFLCIKCYWHWLPPCYFLLTHQNSKDKGPTGETVWEFYQMKQRLDGAHISQIQTGVQREISSSRKWATHANHLEKSHTTDPVVVFTVANKTSLEASQGDKCASEKYLPLLSIWVCNCCPNKKITQSREELQLKVVFFLAFVKQRWFPFHFFCFFRAQKELNLSDQSWALMVYLQAQGNWIYSVRCRACFSYCF